MRAAERVDVVSLHLEEIFPDERKRHSTAEEVVVIVSVYTAEKYRLTVDGEISVLNFYFSEAYFLDNGLEW